MSEEEEKESIDYMHLSDQAIMSIVTAVQDGLLNKEDITDKIRNFSLVKTDQGLVVNNPPRIRVEGEEYEELFKEDVEDGGEDDVIVDPEEMNE